MHRVAMLVVLLAIAPVVSGCANGDFDLDKLDVFGLNEKKKLPGERKEVFPDGVPGVTQGIPPEYMKGNDEGASLDVAPAPQAAAVQPVEEKPKVKPKSKPRTAARPARTNVSAQPQAQQPPQSQEQPAANSPWPSQEQAPSASPWPATPAPGTFSKQ
jgi:hypothetical protein